MKNARSTWQWTFQLLVPWAQGQCPRAPGWLYGQSPSYPEAWKKPILCQTTEWLFKVETTNLEKDIGRQTSIIKTVLSFYKYIFKYLENKVDPKMLTKAMIILT